MISGLKAKDYEGGLKELGMTKLEERRHRLDVLQTFKILRNKDKVEPSTWFTMASVGARITRMTTEPLNIRAQAPRLDIRRQFFSQRVVENGNSTGMPSEIKNKLSDSDQF